MTTLVTRITVLFSAVALLGAGCAPTANAPLELPTVPPSPAAAVTSPDGGLTAEVEGGGSVIVEAVPLDEGESAAAPEPAAPQTQSFYVAYTAAEYQKARQAGRPVLLYFWAGWCPICRAEEPNIKAWTEASGAGVAGFRVDFDTETALKAQFKIPYQHTTVILDASGNESARFTGPVTEAQLTAALAVAAGK